MPARLKVFIADDSQLVRDRLKEVFAEAGSIDVIGESADAEEAKIAIRRLNPDVAILDIRMPSGGGLPVLMDIKAREPHQVVIVLTAYPNPQYRQAFMIAGADYFFDKTKDIQRMSKVLVELAQGHSGMQKKKILLLGDDPATLKVAESAIDPGRDVVTLFSNPPHPTESGLLSDRYDLIILVQSSGVTETVDPRGRALLTRPVGRVPLLILSRQPLQSDRSTGIYHLGIPFTSHELNMGIRGILQEDLGPAPAPESAPVQSDANRQAA